VATFFGVASCTTAGTDEAVTLPIFLHVYSNTRGSTYDQDRQNRRRSRSTVSDWVRVVTLVIILDLQADFYETTSRRRFIFL